MIKNNKLSLEEHISHQAHHNNLSLERIKLIAVSKQQPEDRIDEALSAGQRVFGENRVQEAQKRWAHRRDLYPDLQLHLIGPLQTNKAADAVALFDVIHTLDRPKLIKILGIEMAKQNRNLPCLIQVNTGDETQKSGAHPQDLDHLIRYAKEHNVTVCGLMCLPPINEPATLHFALLKKLAKEHHLPELSMGMSHDFDKAIALGATYIRIGTAFFGDRNKG